MEEPVGYFKKSTAEGILADYQRRVNGGYAPPNVGSAPGTGAAARHLWHNYVLITEGTAGAWTAKKCNESAVALDDTPEEEIIVIGAKMKAGLMVSAHLNGASRKMTAQGYQYRVLDWGTAGNVSPFIVEDISGTLTPRIKTKKTTDGITWTDEKINMDGGECE